MITQIAKNRSTMSPAQISLFVLVAILALSVESLILRAYFHSGSTASEFEEASFSTTNLANLQREALLLRIETDYLIHQVNDATKRDEAIKHLKLRRGLLSNQLRLITAQAADNDRVTTALEEIRRTVDEYDSLIVLQTSGDGLMDSSDIARLIDILSRLELQVKRIYDSEEQGFFVAISVSLRSQRSAQILLLTVSGLVLVLGVILAVSLRRTLHALSVEMAERTRAEQQLAQARDQALAASRSKSEFLASMSHEIRTPMNAIVGMADILAESPLSSEQEEYVGLLRSGGSTLLTLIDDILDLSKVEAGQLHLDEQSFDLVELVEDTAHMMAVRAHAKGLELNCHIKPQVITSVNGDPTRLRQVLSNLLGNAIKFTDAGEVSLYVENVPEADCAGCLRFHISDTGIGVPEEKRQIIFDNFTQADSSTTREYGGTGLGLGISRRLVELMGGLLWMESEVGQGSTFSFTVQLEPGSGPTRPAAAPDKQVEGLKVLVVDDNATNRMILEEMLTSWGAWVTPVGSGPEALRELDRARNADQPFQLVLLDHRMSEMDGLETAKRIKQDLGITNISIVILASDNRREDIDLSRDLGISHYLVKPVKRTELRRTITQSLHAVATEEAQPEELPVAEDSAIPEDQRPLRILIVEDYKNNRLVLQSYLKHTPYLVDIAENGEEAVLKFKASAYDLVLMDMQMPVMDGYAATQAIREWERAEGKKDAPIVALTANALKEDMQRSLDAGCNAHLTKPIRKVTLLKAIQGHTREVTL